MIPHRILATKFAPAAGRLRSGLCQSSGKSGRRNAPPIEFPVMPPGQAVRKNAPPWDATHRSVFIGFRSFLRPDRLPAGDKSRHKRFHPFRAFRTFRSPRSPLARNTRTSQGRPRTTGRHRIAAGSSAGTPKDVTCRRTASRYDAARQFRNRSRIRTGAIAASLRP